MQQAVVEPGALHIDPLGHHEGALELTGGDAAVEKDTPLAVIILAAADHQLVVFLRDLQVVHGEPGHREGDAQSGGADLFNIVGRITVRRRLGCPFKHLLEMVEAEKQR